ncbi:MAG: SDR family NAD(P)-dependent oxidoreductase [Alphaproteobacteria bacterium]|nr:SDR family NAD(P)-dependent oxidoreductase [Alphaproteobacteria bacterium]MCB9985588.1 SDR family NAD(P)-dependent oxidoreductase [Micavibrio sp.]
MTSLNILITGASSGIGEALATHYAQQGHTLFLSGRNPERLDRVTRTCCKLGSTCNGQVIDVRDRKAMERWINNIQQANPLDLVIANAGISGGTGGESGNRDFGLDIEIFDTNLNGVLNTIHPALPTMIQAQKGQIAIISSIASLVPLPGAPAYSASKAAVRFYGEALAAKLKSSGISVSVICPGFIQSRMTQGNDFPMPFIISASRAAQIISRGIECRKIRIDFPLPMVVAMKLVNLIPSAFRRDIFSQLPEKHSHKKPLP